MSSRRAAGRVQDGCRAGAGRVQDGCRVGAGRVQDATTIAAICVQTLNVAGARHQTIEMIHVCLQKHIIPSTWNNQSPGAADSIIK